MALQYFLAGLILFVPGAAMIFINYYLIFKGRYNRKHPEKADSYVPSGAPLYGGILCAVGVLISLQFKHKWLALIPLLADPGGISGIVYCFISELFPRNDSKK
ncbi:hypothetical protein [Ruminococcus albus]|uniref:Uncharacterized protein n=1 Tax=Ruminococcus albus TaxID=1264 RepID=A0A1I1FI18_RUMAL|nr:hypothetical protein [Ruminococcus albus]SFB96700.1 hypothetical protein SAMN02910406_00926 [Ruminococcus albus]